MSTPPPDPARPDFLTAFHAIEGDKRAFFQRWYNDQIPHNAALGTSIVEVSEGRCAMRLDWAEHLVGDIATGILAGGPITVLLDTCSGLAVATRLRDVVAFATLDLRIDYARPAVPGKPVIAAAECYRITANVAFTRAIAHQGDPDVLVAAAAGTFMLGTRGRSVTAVQAFGGQDAPA